MSKWLWHGDVGTRLFPADTIIKYKSVLGSKHTVKASEIYWGNVEYYKVMRKKWITNYGGDIAQTTLLPTDYVKYKCRDGFKFTSQVKALDFSIKDDDTDILSYRKVSNPKTKPVINKGNLDKWTASIKEEIKKQQAKQANLEEFFEGEGNDTEYQLSALDSADYKEAQKILNKSWDEAAYAVAGGYDEINYGSALTNKAEDEEVPYIIKKYRENLKHKFTYNKDNYEWEEHLIPTTEDSNSLGFPTADDLRFTEDRQAIEAALTFDASFQTEDGKQKPSLAGLPAKVLEQVADIKTFGATKYYADKWLKEPTSAYKRVDSAYRHINKWLQKIDLDEESGKNHLDHAILQLMMAKHYLNEGIGEDGR